MDSNLSTPSTHDRVYPFLGGNPVNKIVVTLVAAIPFALTLFAIYRLWGSHITGVDLGLMLAFQAIAGFGITLGFHRMLTHGAFKARAPVRAALLWGAMNSLQGGPASWAATHRRHHALADQPGDPHSPVEGFWHAHFGWLYRGNLVHSGPGYDRLMEDPIVRFFQKTELLWYILTFVLPGFLAVAITGSWGAFWQAVLWAGAVRVFLVHHVTWSINSICHTWGARPYESPDIARNNAIFGVLGWGEGWHNNHHAFPKSAWLGHRWYQVDFGKYLLLALRPFGLVYDLYIPSHEERAEKRARKARAGKRRREPVPA